MRKSIAIIVLISAMLLTFSVVTLAADSLSRFQVVMQKLEISRDGGRTFITIFDNNTSSVDLVALNGQSVGTFIGSAVIPAGTYNYSRVYISDTTLTFTVNDGTHGDGTIIITKNDMPAGTLPRTETGVMSVTVTDGGTVNGVINFDAATSYSGLTYVWNGGSAPNQYTLTGVTFTPNVTVVSE